VTPLLRAENLVKHFLAIQAVDGVSLDVVEGETLALVGESGCGCSSPRPAKSFSRGKTSRR
jgi:ABC-type oligopeptide transport system ATPase subunit